MKAKLGKQQMKILKFLYSEENRKVNDREQWMGIDYSERPIEIIKSITGLKPVHKKWHKKSSGLYRAFKKLEKSRMIERDEKHIFYHLTELSRRTVSHKQPPQKQKPTLDKVEVIAKVIVSRYAKI